MNDAVQAWMQEVIIPTYPVGKPDKNPMFLEKRVYQGSSGAVYPHPVIDRVSDRKEERAYTALFLENRYLKIMILPEIGGRVQMALDKTNGYHFVYYNRVIKPALVGLAGPWISGGIEFNWPQHHRPSTFDPLDWRIQEHADGSKTVWCAEIERMFRTKGMHGFRLYPERAYLEINVQLYNRTSEPQTFLWWANPAVHVHDDYQTVFPPDVHAVMDHGKRDVSSFPIATGTYYKVNYAPGTDISRYKNIPVPTSYMAYHSNFDFMGDYDTRAQAGMLHIANHHVVPGKKQWTWGNGDFGQAWDRQLTDEDGPYIELMCGAYTDNQPDFSWIQPGEEKSFTQVFMPYKQIGPASNASRDAVVHLDVEGQSAQVGVYVSAPRLVRVQLRAGKRVIFEWNGALNPEEALVERVSLPERVQAQDFHLSVWDGQELLVETTPLPDDKSAIPAPAAPARPPEEIESVEELYLNGLHLEQYRHATCAPEPYYREGLRRDPGDARCNNALGLLLYRRGCFAEAQPYFRAAIQRLTLRNPNPYDGEPFYNLGLALEMQGRLEEAIAAFHKSVWNAAWQDAGYYALARLWSRQGQVEMALDCLERCLGRNERHYQARRLRMALLRRDGQIERARAEATRSLELDPLEYGALWELDVLNDSAEFDRLTRGEPATRIELALDAARAGLWDEAARLLLDPAALSDVQAAYTLGWVLAQACDQSGAAAAFTRAAGLPLAYAFPNRLEDVLIYETAMRVQPQDANAPYLLGNFWYAHRQYEAAIACWERSRALDDRFATVHRNLGLAYFNKRGEAGAARASLERAFALDPADARVFYELDQLDKRLNASPAKRLARLQAHRELVEQRDDLLIETINLHNVLGRPDEAHAELMGHVFHPWEGGEGKVTGQYVLSLVELARRAITAGNSGQAIDRLGQAQSYPHSLGEGKLYGAQENNIFYYLGCAYEQQGLVEESQRAFEWAASGLREPTSAMFYNDQPPDMIFYQGLALRRLGREEEAGAIFERLLAYGESHLDDHVTIDYFAVSLPDFLVFEADLAARNRLHCHYMMALGALGLGRIDQARAHFDAALSIDASHAGAAVHRQLLPEK